MAKSYVFEDETIDAIERLRSVFQVSSNTEVISRALALAQMIGDQANNEHMVVVVGKDEPIKLDLTK